MKQLCRVTRPRQGPLVRPGDTHPSCGLEGAIMTQVFLSYTRHDLPTLQPLLRDLGTHGITIWRDQEHLYGGQRWPQAIGEAIAAHDTLLLIWSQAAAASHYVELEWNTAIALHKRIVPCLLDQTPPPPALSAMNGIETRQPREAVPHILRALQQAVTPLSPAQGAPILTALGNITATDPAAVVQAAKALFMQQGWRVQGNVYQAGGDIHLTLPPTVLLCCLPPTVQAQERWLRGEVFHLGEHGEKRPDSNVTVIMKHSGDRSPTDARGLFRVFLPKAFKAGEKVTLDVEKPDWRIHYPLDGEVRIPDDLQKTLVEIRLLPVGSKLFWTHDRIEKFIQDTAEQSRQQVRPEGKPEDIDFSQYIKELAEKYGFTPQQAREEISKWVAETKKTARDPYALGLAAFAEKNFAEASVLFNESAELKAQKLAAMEQEKRKLTEEVVRDFRLTGDAHYNNYAFDKSLQAYQRALGYASREHTPQVWAAALLDVGAAHWALGTRTAGQEVHRHLTEAVTALRHALAVSTRDTLPQQWAMTQNNLGLVLREQGTRTGGEPGALLLAEAVTALRHALAVSTRDTLPQQWAMTQNNLGLVLHAQGTRTGGEPGTRLLAEAVTAYWQALEVSTRDTLPQDWAATQNNLGLVLHAQGTRTGGEPGALLLAEAVTAYRQALEVLTRDTLP
ncbi:MAG: TIR domain-containing protein, partial [Candidatus Tectomicrobia bacterium]|nr:TIR domain-containing protein [Candidatus Tectomicrobia bacterium]